MKRVASIQDISCLGRCSLTVALPVISAMEVECAILPTAVLSAHTMFPDILCRDLTADILPIARYWQSQQVRLDAVYTGYLASPRQVEDVCQALEVLAGPDTLRFVDPAMADGGALYTGFDEDFPRHMARLAAQADVVTPNLTEACLLTGTPYREDYDLPRLRDILRKLAELGPRHVVLTGVPYGPDKLGVLAYTPYCFFHRHEQPFRLIVRQHRQPPHRCPFSRHGGSLLLRLRRCPDAGQAAGGGPAFGGGFHAAVHPSHLPG